MPNVLILTGAGDTHAYAVSEGLSKLGANVTLWHTSDYPAQSHETIAVYQGKQSIKISSPDFQLACSDHFDTVWNRRPAYSLDKSQLHPADQEFAWSECATFRHSLFSLLAPQAFWVNPVDSSRRSTNKPLQHHVATSLGFLTPDTLYSNDPGAIRNFIQSCGKPVIYKPYRPIVWKDNETEHALFTSIVTLKDLESDLLLSLVPGIYQELVPKAYELRLTICGLHVFGAKVFSQQTQAGQIDWRKAYSELRFETAQIPESLAQKCCALLNSLGLVFGCIDLIVRPDGEVVFLEINEMGQFLFLENYSRLPALDIFCAFLIQSDPKFRYSTTTPAIALNDIRDAVASKLAQYSCLHVPLQPASVTEWI